jgi:uncharacterized protein (TIGR03086 family)
VSDITELFNKSIEEFDKRVRLVGDDQWELPTPCSEWNVRDLVNHLVYEDRWARPLFEGKTVAEVGDAFEGDLLGVDPVTAWESACEEARASATEPGAMERTVHLSFGDFPGSEYAGQLYTDHVIHAWDLARAIGADESLDNELVESCFARNKPLEEILKASGAYGERIEPPEDADTQTKLLAVMGREP